jgi:hypothetical protein
LIDFRHSRHTLVVIDKFISSHTLDFLIEGLEVDFNETTIIAQAKSVAAIQLAV